MNELKLRSHLSKKKDIDYSSKIGGIEMEYSNIRIVNVGADDALGWTTINEGPNSIQVPTGTQDSWNAQSQPFNSNVWPGQVLPPPNMPPYGPPMMGPSYNQPPKQSEAPKSPPPNFTPQQSQAKPFAIDPGGIANCLYRYVYIWPTGSHGRGYWVYFTYVGHKSIAGFRWNGRYWVYGGIDLRRIESFQCY